MPNQADLKFAIIVAVLVALVSKNITDSPGAILVIPFRASAEVNKLELWKWEEVSEKAFLVYTFLNLTKWGVAVYRSKIIITGTSDNKIVAYSFDGAQIKEIFDDQTGCASDVNFSLLSLGNCI